MKYANVIVDISLEKLDRTFQYRVPAELEDGLSVGMQVVVPFGNGSRRLTAYVVELTDQCEWDPERVKDIIGIAEKGIRLEGQMIALAAWMRRMYGSTMNQALKTVLPVKQKVRQAVKKRIRCLLGQEELAAAIREAEKKGFKARLRLLTALRDQGAIPYEQAAGELKLTAASLAPLQEAGVIAVEVVERYRNPLLELRGVEAGNYSGEEGAGTPE